MAPVLKICETVEIVRSLWRKQLHAGVARYLILNATGEMENFHGSGF